MLLGIHKFGQFPLIWILTVGGNLEYSLGKNEEIEWHTMNSVD